MHQLILNELISTCERRYKDGDFPVDPQPNTESLENAVLELAHQVTLLRQKLAEAHPAPSTEKVSQEPCGYVRHDYASICETYGDTMLVRKPDTVRSLAVFTTPQPTPTVQAAVAAALRKAAEVCRLWDVISAGQAANMILAIKPEEV